MKKVIIILFLFILTSSCSKLNFFGFGKEKNEFDKLKINEYLWIASNELLKNYTNTQSNLKEGTISTDWFTAKKAPNIRFRITIYILGSDLYEENIEIFTEKQLNQNGIWKQQQTSGAFNIHLKKRIILNATSLDPEQ